MFRWRQAEAGHELSWIVETLKIPNLDHHRHRDDEADAAHRLMCGTQTAVNSPALWNLASIAAVSLHPICSARRDTGRCHHDAMMPQARRSDNSGHTRRDRPHMDGQFDAPLGATVATGGNHSWITSRGGYQVATQENSGPQKGPRHVLQKLVHFRSTDQKNVSPELSSTPSLSVDTHAVPSAKIANPSTLSTI